jgi:hypothetical protein
MLEDRDLTLKSRLAIETVIFTLNNDTAYSGLTSVAPA